MRKELFLLTLPLIVSCTTMNDSLELGSGLGLAAGAATTYAGYSTGGRNPTLETVAVGAGIGATLGLLTSYFTHRKVAEDRQSCQAEQVESHYGDLPPSPFVVPQMSKRKGGN